MTTTTDVLRKLAEDNGNYIALDLGSTRRLVMHNGDGKEICTVPGVHFDNLRELRYLEDVDGKWHLNDAGKVAAKET